MFDHFENRPFPTSDIHQLLVHFFENRGKKISAIEFQAVFKFFFQFFGLSSEIKRYGQSTTETGSETYEDRPLIVAGIPDLSAQQAKRFEQILLEINQIAESLPEQVINPKQLLSKWQNELFSQLSNSENALISSEIAQLVSQNQVSDAEELIVKELNDQGAMNAFKFIKSVLVHFATDTTFSLPNLDEGFLKDSPNQMVFDPAATWPEFFFNEMFDLSSFDTYIFPDEQRKLGVLFDHLFEVRRDVISSKQLKPSWN